MHMAVLYLVPTVISLEQRIPDISDGMQDTASEPQEENLEIPSEPQDKNPELPSSEPQAETAGIPTPETIVTDAGDMTVYDTYFMPDTEELDENVVFSYRDEGEFGGEFAITPTAETVQDFKIISISLDEDGTFYAADVLGDVGFLSAGEVVKVRFALGDFDTRGISYTDMQGNVYAFSINTDGRDGSVYAAPVEIVQYRDNLHDLTRNFNCSFSAIMDTYGQVIDHFYWNGSKYFRLERDPQTAFGFEGDPESDADKALCTAIHTTANALFKNFDRPMDVQALQKILSISDMFMDDSEDAYGEGTAETAEWFLGNSGISARVSMSEAGMIHPEDPLLLISYGYLQ